MPEPAPRAHRLRPWLAAIAAVVPLVPIAIAVSLSGGSAAAPAATAVSSPFTPVTAPKPTPTPAPRTLIPAGWGQPVALLQRPAVLRRSPGGRSYGRLGVRTGFGSAQVLLVVRLSGRWLGVLSPLAGNGRIGWVPAAAASLSRVQWHLELSLSRRELTVSQRGHTVERYRVAIGAPASPTPTGRFAVTDRLRTGDPTGPYGCCILALSAQSPHAIQGWSGGNRIAIHSTPETSSIGLPVSHGCIRLTLAEGRWLLRHIPLGTPTSIRT